ncbi:Hypothetical protein A7982_07891 [Minicystis rosea]|nr:Hypothetical protein A7982_07891 [Minicystis rosea]
MHALFLVSVVALGLLLPLAAFDGLYLHLWKFRLFARSETRVEHAIHTLRAVLGAFALWLVFRGDTVGPTLWLGVSIVIIDVGVGAWDMAEETRSRRPLGGLPQGEAALHLVATTLHVVGVTTSLAARPLDAWAWANRSPSSALVAAASIAHTATSWLLPGTLAMAVLHVVLMMLPARLRMLASQNAVSR